MFWRDTLPARAIDRILCSKEECYEYDELIIDEAQDLLLKEYIDFLDLILKNGWRNGRWRLFGDFEKQSIYGDTSSPIETISGLTVFSAAPQYCLRVNCRNLPRTASWAELLGGLNPGYSKILRPDDGKEPERHYYDSEKEQESTFTKALKDTIARGFRPDEIVVLSPRSLATCLCARLCSTELGHMLTPYKHNKLGSVRYTSIHAFKGLESPVIIMTDIDDISNSLFYIAVTRSLERLIIIARSKVKKEMARILLQ